jgi:GeoRSP system SPASM domain protein
VPVPDYDRICSEIASSRALTIHLTDLSEALSRDTFEIVNRLSVTPLVLLVTVSHTAFPEALTLLESGVRKLYADVKSPEAIGRFSGKAISGVSFRTSRSNHYLLPGVISTCIDNGIAELQLPMERLAAGEEPLCLSVVERECLAARISENPFEGRLTVTANDPFLWRVVHPETPFPDGICQAANTMLAIAPNGDIYPCPAMPILLGNLQNSTFREIVASPLKKEVRTRILARPEGCMECSMLDDCRGGCRGRGFYVRGTLEAADPGCEVL